MSKSVRRTTIVAAGLAVFGAVLSGTALAMSNDDHYPDCERTYPKQAYEMPGYNGHRADDRSYGSDDYRPDCTGFHGRESDRKNGYLNYNGYNGKDESRYHDSDYLFGR